MSVIIQCSTGQAYRKQVDDNPVEICVYLSNSNTQSLNSQRLGPPHEIKKIALVERLERRRNSQRNKDERRKKILDEKGRWTPTWLHFSALAGLHQYIRLVIIVYTIQCYGHAIVGFTLSINLEAGSEVWEYCILINFPALGARRKWSSTTHSI